MLFSSPIFLFVFLPLFLLVYFLIGRRLRNALLLVASLFFYTWGEGKLVTIMLTSTVIDYVAGLAIERGFRGMFRWRLVRAVDASHRRRSQTAFLVLSIVANLALLGFFKYFNFGIDNLNGILSFFGWQTASLQGVWQIVLPLGISFYTFQSMSYTIDVYRGRIRANPNFIDYAAYVTMFPQLVAGPIVRYETVARELVTRLVSRSSFASGIQRFIIGLSKKMLIANQVAVPADAIFALPADALTTPLAWFGVVCYALQIYFDFSGYSDMAIGLGRMLGFTFLENFNYPYIARSIRDFWRRWHISLSTWFRDYLYIPLGGSRNGRYRTYVNLIIVFFITGLWHGASWNFVVWGLYHGFFLLLERLGFGELLERLWRPLRHGYVLLVVLISWVFFRADSLGGALSYLRAMFGGVGDGNGLYHLGLYASSVVVLAVTAGVIGSMPIIPWLRDAVGRFRRGKQAWSYAIVVALVMLMIITVMHMANDTYNPFIYFRF